MSTAMPIRCGPPSPGCWTSSQRARSHTQLPLAWRMRKAWSTRVAFASASWAASSYRSMSSGWTSALTSPKLMQRVARLQSQDREHGVRPEHAAAREVPVPQSAAAAVERGIDARAHGLVDRVGFARARRLPVEGEAQDEHDEAGGGRERDGQRRVGDPGRQRIARGHAGSRARRSIAGRLRTRAERQAAVGEGNFQHAGRSAERGQRLRRAEHVDQPAPEDARLRAARWLRGAVGAW